MLLRVLVADTEALINEGLTALLSDFEGLSVFGCTQQPAKILTLIDNVHPDIVLLELPLNTATGLVTLKMIKQLPNAPKVIVLVRFDLPALRKAALTAGADHCLNLSTDCAVLAELLRTAQAPAPFPPNEC